MWAGGGNVNPFLGLAEDLLDRGHRVGAVATTSLHDRRAASGIDPVGAPDSWLPGADDVLRAVSDYSPDVLVIDYMLTAALCGTEAAGRPTVAFVHTLYRALLHEGAPGPIEMAGSVDELNDLRVTHGLAPVTSHAELLQAVDVVFVAASRELDARLICSSPTPASGRSPSPWPTGCRWSARSIASSPTTRERSSASVPVAPCRPTLMRPPSATPSRPSSPRPPLCAWARSRAAPSSCWRGSALVGP
jgi:hypothetical protein